ncbi:MAG: hypothetical protein HYY20_04500 [Candidatus Tectomicrobia bacterium]|uniref:UvrD-like helicase C-terminal domain-containing protein n=1 Tax=Tectimicrobiota bacterium TaxID=2528274 RepID=A0A932CN48_UNCTE|nr:hypothetical protein [Candidatus Tectomicrobia bacterium]
MTAKENWIKVAIASDFLTAFSRIPRTQQAKVLEFDRVIIAGVNAEIVPYEGVESESSDPVVRRESEVHERALLYVSATRAKKEVVVTSFGKASQLLSQVSQQ